MHPDLMCVVYTRGICNVFSYNLIDIFPQRCPWKFAKTKNPRRRIRSLRSISSTVIRSVAYTRERSPKMERNTCRKEGKNALNSKTCLNTDINNATKGAAHFYPLSYLLSLDLQLNTSKRHKSCGIKYLLFGIISKTHFQ